MHSILIAVGVLLMLRAMFRQRRSSPTPTVISPTIHLRIVLTQDRDGDSRPGHLPRAGSGTRPRSRRTVHKNRITRQ